MMNLVTVKSKTTGLVGVYPESHLALDPDLEVVSTDEDVCVDCVVEPVTEKEETPEEVFVPEYTPRKGKKD